MRRRLYTLAAGVSWVVLAVVLAAWGRSYLPDDFFLRSDRGRLVFLFAGPEYSQYIDPPRHGTPGGLRWSTRRALDDARMWAVNRPDRVNWAGAGFALVAGPAAVPGSDYFVLAVPFWLLAAGAAAACGWVMAARRRMRARPGHCAACGYDLAGNRSGVCPECGTPVPVEKGAA